MSYLAWRDAHARVYFARVADYVKVGCSTNVKARLGAIRNPRSVKCPADLPRDIRPTVLGTIPGGYDVEESVLTQLVIDCGPNSRAAGEWFHATPEVLAWITERVEAAAA